MYKNCYGIKDLRNGNLKANFFRDIKDADEYRKDLMFEANETDEDRFVFVSLKEDDIPSGSHIVEGNEPFSASWSRSFNQFSNQKCQYCGYEGQNDEWKHGICPRCGNETTIEKCLKSIAKSLEDIASWCNENYHLDI